MRIATLFAGLLLAAGATLAVASEPGELTAASGALASYVAKPDPTYGWQVRARYQKHGAEMVELTLESQTWRGGLWKHQMMLIKPSHVSDPGHGLLIVGGGRWRDSYETDAPPETLGDDADIFIAIARRLNTVVAVVGQVPFQPLFDRREDQLIAYTFDQYLHTGDTEWPLLLPMVKAAVRAMDASSEAAAKEWGTPLETFTVLGGSKRGWTTWLTAAVDRRVTGLVPAVIDALDMERHFPYQTEVWGAPSDKIRPYTDLNLDKVLGSDDGAALRRIVDPFEYRAAIVQPKLVVLATNDHYFPVDSANLYWDSLVGPKYLLYLPNNQHSIKDYRRLIPSLDALNRSVVTGESLPTLEWEYRFGDDTTTLCVRSTPTPRHVRLWSAPSADRDFREAVWTAAPDHGREHLYTFAIPRPATGYVGVFAEAEYGRGLFPYSFSTNLVVLAAPDVRAIGARPAGTPGVCDVPAVR
ncbi:MAG TPA: PhoPQ-activated protein PqaA family protein [Gammaproteobacteria bacterium]|nr:PhoPQ-activated protein PqaA family protein [Gammaproteobacteria bacterium]